MFVSILGAEAGNLALTVMATGGIYIAGGIRAAHPRGVAAESGALLSAFQERAA